MIEYKVVEIKKKSFWKGAMKVEQLEELLNEYGRDGWILDRIVTGETAGKMNIGDKDVLIIVFRREVDKISEPSP